MPQARANVLFESGLALGRMPEHTILVELGPLRPFSDIAGRHAIRMDNSAEKRKELAQRLRTAGCAVDTTGNDWLREGDFEGAVLPTALPGAPSPEKASPTQTLSHFNDNERRFLIDLWRSEDTFIGDDQLAALRDLYTWDPPTWNGIRHTLADRHGLIKHGDHVVTKQSVYGPQKELLRGWILTAAGKALVAAAHRQGPVELPEMKFRPKR